MFLPLAHERRWVFLCGTKYTALHVEGENKDRTRSKVVQHARRPLRKPLVDRGGSDSPTVGCYRHRTPLW